MKWGTVAFLGWFGPRGIASLLYALLLLEGITIPGANAVLSVAMTTVFLSIFAHGITACPATLALARYLGRAHPTAAEHVEVKEMPVRIRYISERSTG